MSDTSNFGDYVNDGMVAIDLTAVTNFMVSDCSFLCAGTSSAWAVAVQLGAASNGTFRSCYWSCLDAGTMTAGVSGTGVAVADAINFLECRTGISPGVAMCTGLTSADGSLINNYLGTNTGGTGGTLISKFT